MAKKDVLGHMPCPECGHPDAEIKMQKCGVKLYRYCPECNVQTFARTPAQEKAMRAAITTPPVTGTDTGKPATDDGGLVKAVKPAPAKKAAPPVSEKPATPPEPPAPPKKPGGLADALSFLTGGK